MLASKLASCYLQLSYCKGKEKGGIMIFVDIMALLNIFAIRDGKFYDYL